MYKLIYDNSHESLIEVTPDGKRNVISDEFPSGPTFSPNGKHATYIAPLEWEVPGDLYLYNLENGKNIKLITPDEEQNIPKYAIWLNDKTIAVIIGFGHGTVSIGGNVFTYNIENSELKQITNYPGEIQITKIELKGELLLLRGIKYIDEILNEFEDFKAEMIVNDCVN